MGLFPLTPAHAGNRPGAKRVYTYKRFNPRARGEHYGMDLPTAEQILQPPRTRGTSSLIITCSWRVSTPACAEQFLKTRGCSRRISRTCSLALLCCVDLLGQLASLQVGVALEHLQRFVPRNTSELEHV